MGVCPNLCGGQTRKRFKKRRVDKYKSTFELKKEKPLIYLNFLY
jgi:hypothetical protein